MTTIAWDGMTLAADKRATTSNGNILVTTKIFRISGKHEYAGFLFATSGDACAGRLMLEWLERGAPVESFPQRQSNPDLRATCLVITKQGGLLYFLDSPVPMLPEQVLFTLGSGGDFAMGAMKMGAGAAEAVRIACECDAYSGNGIDKLHLVEFQP